MFLKSKNGKLEDFEVLKNSVERIKNNSNQLKQVLSFNNDLGFSLQALSILEKDLLQKNRKGSVIESPEDMFARVAKCVASVEKKKKKWESEFFGMLRNREFLPNSRTLANAGTKKKQLCASYVLELPSSLNEMDQVLKDSAKIFHSGGGVGFSFSKIKPMECVLNTNSRIFSGPASFVHLFDKAAEKVKEKGLGNAPIRGALRIDHPDILDFARAKEVWGSKNLHFSVAISDDFMKAVVNDEGYWLKSGDGKKLKQLRAREVYDYLCTSSWETGNPEMLFVDEINRKNNLKKLGRINSSEPCGELNLLSDEASCLGAINLSRMLKGKHINWVKLGKVTRLGVRFLDNVLAVNQYPNNRIKNKVLSNRKIGLGIMGWADLLATLNISYGSPKSLKLAKDIMKFVRKNSEEESVILAREKGAFPNFNKSSLKKERRNANLLAIAPTGNISVLAGCSSGIEPLFGVAYLREVLGLKFFEVNETFAKRARFNGFYDRQMLERISKKGSVKGVKGVPGHVQEVFSNSMEVELEKHIDMQAVFQSYVDNAVSKTINLPLEANIGDVKRAYMLAWKQGCKSLSVHKENNSNLHYSRGQNKEHSVASLNFCGGHLNRNCEY